MPLDITAKESTKTLIPQMSRKLDFDPDKDIPRLTGKVIIITGGTAGLGRETLLSFAAHDPSRIFFTGRSQTSADEVLREARTRYPSTPVSFIPCNLASLAHVRDAARTILARTDRLDLAFMNAGIMAVPPGLTEDGYEIQFGTNHLGHALLVKLLTPLLEATAETTGDVRVVWNTSQGYAGHPRGGIIFDRLKTDMHDFLLAPWQLYGQSKLANMLYAKAYNRHHPDILSVAVHPGVAYTGLVTGLSWGNRMFTYLSTWRVRISAEQCAWNQQWAATAVRGDGKGEVRNGVYYEPVGVETKVMRQGGDDELGEKLWEWTDKELQGYQL